METIINVSGKDYNITSDTELTPQQMNSVLKQIETLSCSNCNSSIKTLTATCTRKTAKVGDVVTLEASGSGGTPNYTIQFIKAGTNLTGCVGTDAQCSCPNVPANTTKKCKYTISDSDSFPIVFKVVITDANGQTCEESCTITQIPKPSCSFTVT